MLTQSPRRAIASELPRQVYIEVTNRCNSLCGSCPLTYDHFLPFEPKHHLTWDQFRQIVDQLPVIERAVLHGIGEPLLNPELPRFIKHLKERGAHVVFNSNAVLLTQAKGDQLAAAGLDELRVSMDGATRDMYRRLRGIDKFDQIIANVRAFITRQRERDREHPRVSFWFVGMQENLHQLPDFVRLAADVGVSEAYLQRMTYFGDGEMALEATARADNALYGTLEEQQAALLHEAEALAGELGLRFQASGATTPGESMDVKGAHPWQGCYRPWALTYITANGTVLPCCIAPFATTDFPQIVLGNVFEQPLADVWNGKPYMQLRTAVLSEKSRTLALPALRCALEPVMRAQVQDRETGRPGDRETGSSGGYAWSNLRVSVSPRLLSFCVLPALAFALALALYVRTGAPSILTGDQAEHQFTAYLVGVPHATGYPLFTGLNALAVRLLPWGDVARRVTLMTALWSALAVMMAFVVARRLSGSWLAGVFSATTLAVSTEFWSLATITEVYTLQALLILLIWWFLLRWWAAPEQMRWLYCAAFCSGVAVTHHGSFVPIVVPALLFAVALPYIGEGKRQQQTAGSKRSTHWLLPVAFCLLSGMLGLIPWLYLAVQFALFHPFDYYRGQGLPYHYYWGEPSSWGDVVNLAFGAGFRGKVFTYGWGNLWALTLRFGEMLRGQMWWSGLLLGGLGGIVLLLRHRHAGRFSALIFVGAALFGINVAGDIPKAHVYYLPAYVVWSVWVGVGASWLAHKAQHLSAVGMRRWRGGAMPRLSFAITGATSVVLILLIALPLVRGWRHIDQLDRSGDDIPRLFATAVLAQVEPQAVILCRWELCEALRYLQFVEGQRLDVLLDQTEPEAGSNWAERAAIYLPQHPVYAVQFNQQLAARYDLYPVSETYDLWQILGPHE